LIKNKTYNRQNLLFLVCMICVIATFLAGRLAYLMISQADHYGIKAQQLHERERSIKAERGVIYDRNGIVIAGNKPVSTISVIHSQIKEPEKIISILSKELGISQEMVRKRVSKVSSIERVKSNVDKETSDRIRSYNLAGVMVDEDYKRYYPYGTLASKVIGFTGSDNQGIIGLEVSYEKYLKGIDGAILTLTTANGVEIKNAAEDRVEPVAGSSLFTSIDINMQQYAEQAAKQVMEEKQAKKVSLILMNPQNGEIYAMVNTPEFDLNQPYNMTINGNTTLTEVEKMKQLNEMWRNPCISDTYEPGSTFKIITATAALEEKVVNLTDTFHCPGFRIVEDRRIRCHKTTGHGSETFVQGVLNSCNPVFIDVGARVGVSNMYKYFNKLGVLKKTGIDLPGEAKTIMHNPKDVGAVELATVSFGQSFQMTPINLMAAVSCVVNGGNSVVPHFGVEVQSADKTSVTKLKYRSTSGVVSSQTSETMRSLLESVVSEGTGKKAYVTGYHVAAKTGTSEKLPRGTGKYISSCLSFAPATNPQVLALILIDEPVGIYYGGAIAAPIVQKLFGDILPYMGVQADYTEKEITENNIGTEVMCDFVGKTKDEVQKMIKLYQFDEIHYIGNGDVV